MVMYKYLWRLSVYKTTMLYLLLWLNNVYQGYNMHDTADILKNIESIYSNDNAFAIIKDFERVLDELDLYVYANWQDGELIEGPIMTKHYVSCKFMWPMLQMPDPMGGKRLLDYDCRVTYKKDQLVTARKIVEPNDVRPGTKKGKLDTVPVWIVEITMPINLMKNIFDGMQNQVDFNQEPTKNNTITDIQDTAAVQPINPEI
jgi:hypothetical protein